VDKDDKTAEETVAEPVFRQEKSTKDKVAIRRLLFLTGLFMLRIFYSQTAIKLAYSETAGSD
jgi:hypothetical protein